MTWHHWYYWVEQSVPWPYTVPDANVSGDGTGGKIDHAFNNEQTPALAVAGGLDAGEDGEDAVDEHIGGKENDEHLHREGGIQQADQAEDDAENAAQADQPPTFREDLVQRVAACLL